MKIATPKARSSPMALIERTVDFLNHTGIRTTIFPGATGFLPHIRIEYGSIFVDPLCHVSDLLHEAGHIAIFPSAYRRTMNMNIAKAQRLMLDDLDTKSIHPDSQLYRAAIQSSDPEATAWAWAAGVYLDIDQFEIIGASPIHYDGHGASIRSMLLMGRYAGIHGLAHAGFCSVNKISSGYRKLPVYPELAMWLQH